MNSPAIDAAAVTAARARLEAWLETMRVPGGYGGPSVSPRGAAMAFCGAGHDARWEGLLDAWGERHRRTGAAEWLDRTARALEELADAQLRNGVFRNSAFERNPLEGGMPHEAAVVAAALRAMARLRAAGRPVPPRAAALAERFVEERLIRELWNKLLRTFNDWLQSEFETYAPASVAAIVETLLAYGDLAGAGPRLEPFVAGAAESLLRAQVAAGPLAGALPVTHRKPGAAAPHLAARGLPAFRELHRRTGDDRFRAAGETLSAWLRAAATDGCGFAWTVEADRRARGVPRLTGAAAGVLTALARAGDPAAAGAAAAHLPWILARQTDSGAFETGVGFGGRARRGGVCDWRDALPVCAWNAAVYHLLALCEGEEAAAAPAAVAPVRRSVRLPDGTGVLTEDANELRLEGRGGAAWFAWTKGRSWPGECRL